MQGALKERYDAVKGTTKQSYDDFASQVRPCCCSYMVSLVLQPAAVSAAAACCC